jgi:hypothetical protein
MEIFRILGGVFPTAEDIINLLLKILRTRMSDMMAREDT